MRYFAAALIAALTITGLSGFILWKEWQEAHANAATSVLNTARVLANEIENGLDQVDAQLISVGQRYLTATTLGDGARERFEAQVRREIPLYPMVSRIGVSDQTGQMVFNTQIDASRSPLPSIADRGYFQKARAGETGPFFDGPLQAKLDGDWSIVLARRLSGADGDFRGVVFAVIPVESIGRHFSTIDLGSTGIINLRTTDLAQVVRYPALSGLNREVGNRNVSSTIRRLIADPATRQGGTYRTVAPIDGSERVYGYQQFAHSPFYMTVGRATVDFTRQWLMTALALALLCLIVILALVWMSSRMRASALRLHRQNLELEQRVSERTFELEQERDALQASERQFRRLSERLHRILASANIATWEWQIDTGQVVLDERWAAMAGYRLEELEPISIATWERLVHPDDLECSNTLLQRHFAGQSDDYECEARIRHKLGFWVWILDTGRVLRWGADGEPLMMVGIHQNITQRKEAELALERARDSAEAANQAKTDFLANMSHEIRTPLSALQGLTYLLADTSLTEEQSEILNKIRLSSRTLLTLVGDVLDLAKIEAGEVDIERIPFSLSDLLDELLEIFTSLARDKGLNLEVAPLSGDCPALIEGDVNRLRQILVNLLSNAIKFTEHGGITLSVSPLDAPDGEPRLSLEIKDSGVGIPSERLATLFERFTQADTSTTRRFGGSGLGLSIVKHLCELMGGQIEVDSTPGLGSRFRVILPFQPVDLDSSSVIGARHAPLDIVIADDDPAQREDLARIARSLGWTVLTLPDGPSLIEHVLACAEARRIPDCLIVDWRMPGLDGLQAIATLRDRLAPEPLPATLIITAYELDDLRERPHADLPDSLLVKPANGSTLFNEVNAAVAKRSGNPERVLIGTQLEGSRLRWLDGVRILLVDDSELSLDVTQRILERQGARVSTSLNGQEMLTWLETSQRATDIILLDMQMPVMDGYSAARALRGQPATEKIPIVALTAGALLSERQRALDAGVDAYLTKPINPLLMLKTIRQCVETHRGEPIPVVFAEEVSRSATSNWPRIEGLDTAAVRERIGDDPALYRAMLQRLSGELEALRASNPRASLADPADWPDLAARLHRLAGNATLSGAMAIGASAKALETRLSSSESGSPEPLLDALDQDIASVEQALNSPASLTATMPSPDRGTTTTQALDPVHLGQLITMLDGQDLAARRLAAELDGALRARLSPEAANAFRAAMGNLAFAEARDILRKELDKAD